MDTLHALAADLFRSSRTTLLAGVRSSDRVRSSPQHLEQTASEMAVAELERRPPLQEMPAQYTLKTIGVWERSLESGPWSQYQHIADSGTHIPSFPA